MKTLNERYYLINSWHNLSKSERKLMTSGTFRTFIILIMDFATQQNSDDIFMTEETLGFVTTISEMF